MGPSIVLLSVTMIFSRVRMARRRLIGLAFHLVYVLTPGGQDKTIRVWDRQTLQCRHVLTGHLGEVVTLTYCDSSDEGLPSRFHYNRSPFSKGLKPLKMRGGRGYLVSGADDGGVKIWSASTYAVSYNASIAI